MTYHVFVKYPLNTDVHLKFAKNLCSYLTENSHVYYSGPADCVEVCHWC
jgi:hypothetical protein